MIPVHDIRWKTAYAGYSPHFVTLVKTVDALEHAAKGLPAALHAIESLKKLVANDPDVQALPGMDKDAPLQQVEFVAEALKDAEKALSGIGRVYDEANSAFMRMRLK
jgi:hypothetical protein